MAHHRNPLVWLLSAVLFVTPGHPVLALESAGLFQGISTANVFRLCPPRVETNSTPPRARIRLIGLYAFAAEKRALLQVELPGKGPEPAKAVFLILGEGQQEGEIKLLEIDARAGAVRLLNFGAEVRVAFEDNNAPPRVPGTPRRETGPSGMPGTRRR